MSQDLLPQISDRVVDCWNIQPLQFMGGRQNQHWLVETDGSRFVLRGTDRSEQHSV